METSFRIQSFYNLQMNIGPTSFSIQQTHTQKNNLLRKSCAVFFFPFAFFSEDFREFGVWKRHSTYKHVNHCFRRLHHFEHRRVKNEKIQTKSRQECGDVWPPPPRIVQFQMALNHLKIQTMRLHPLWSIQISFRSVRRSECIFCVVSRKIIKSMINNGNFFSHDFFQMHKRNGK